MVSTKIAALGEIMQIAFVPQDFDAAIEHWLTLGAGPFFVLRDARVKSMKSYGVEADLSLDIAFGNWGGIQIEIIHQNSGEKSIYSDWFDAKREGVHHTCIVVDDMQRARDICQKSGFDVLLEGHHNGAEWIYFDTHGGPGTLLEIFSAPAGSFSLSAMSREAAQNWDGKDPIRELVIPA